MPRINIQTAREIVISEEHYAPRVIVINEEAKPILRHLTKGVEVLWGEVRAQGQVRLDGVDLNYQDMRIYLR